MKIFRYISIATISVMLIGGFFIPNTLATRPCNDGNNINGDGCSATGQLEETYSCQEITNENGWYGRYYNHSRTEADFSVPYPGDGPYRGDPLGEWTGNWYNQQFFRFNRVDSNLTFGADFYPFDMAPEEFDQTYGHEYLFTAHWRAQITVDQTGEYPFTETSDDDSWIYLDGVLVGDNHGHHPQRTITGSMTLEAGQEYIVDIFFAERRVYNSHMFFEFDGNPEGMAIVPMPQDCENDPPTASDDNYSVDENSILVVNSLNSILLNDTDPDNYPSPLTASLVNSPVHGNLSLNSDGTFTYTPNNDFYGTDSFTYQAFDGWEHSNTSTVSINIDRVNDVPIAVDDNYSVDENDSLIITIPGVLVNDTDDNYPNSLTVSLETNAINGNVTLNPDGSFNYTPNTDFFGNDSFTYQAYDGEDYSNTATVTINVDRINDIPQANDDTYSVDENSLLIINTPGVLVNDTDPDNYPNPLTVELISNVTNGSLTLNANGSFNYTPITDYFGNDLFTYRVFDGESYSNTATVTINVDRVNEVPVANNDNYSVDENTVLNINIPGVLVNDTDSDNYPSGLTVVLESNVTNGSLTLNANGSFTYIPTSDYFGSDSFTYQAYDGDSYSNTAIVTITVYQVNQVPEASPDSYSVDENTVLNISVPGVLVNDTDSDNYPSPLTSILVDNVTHGVLTLNSNGSFSYTPYVDYFGTDSFTYHAFDGESYSNTVTVDISVNRVNDAPIANNDTYSVDENTTLNISVPGVLNNDNDPDNYPNALIAELVADVSNGSLTLNSNGSFTYIPDTDYFGPDSFTYHAFDGESYSNTVTVNITVNRVNRVPIANNDNYSVDENTVLNISIPGVLINDTDSDNYPVALTVVLESDVSNGSLTLNSDGSFTYIPDTDYFGSDSFTYQAFDGEDYSNTATVTIEVGRVNEIPQANDDTYSVDENTVLNINVPGVLNNDTDPDNYPNPLVTNLVADVTHGVLTLNSNGSFSYTPNVDYFGADSFTYQAFDGESYSNTVTVNITVNRVNDVPVANNDTYSVDENESLIINIPGVLTNDIDTDNYPSGLTVVLESNVTNGSLTLNANGSFIYIPTSDFYGSDSFTYQAYDGASYSNTATVTIEVGRVNDVPVASDDSYSVDENDSLTITIPGVLGNDTDPDDYPAPLSAILISNVVQGALTLNPDGSFTYTPNTDYFGSDSFTYQAFDGDSYSNTALVTITVNEVIDLITDVAVSKTLLTKGEIYPGDIIQFELKVENIGDLAIVNFDAIDQYDNSLLAYWDADPIQPDLITDSTIEWHDLFSLEKPLESGQMWINHIYFQVNPEAPAGIGSNTFLVNDVIDENENIFPEDEGVTIKFDITELPVENIAPKAFDDQYILGENYSDQPAIKDIPQVKEVKTKNIFHKVKEKLSTGVNKLISLASFKEAKAITVDEVKGEQLIEDIKIDAVEIKPDDELKPDIKPEIIPEENPTVTPGNGGYSAPSVNVITVEGSLVVDVTHGLLVNDTDPDNGPDKMTVQMVDDVSHGVLALNSDGSFTYTPDNDYFGSDSFTYRVFDGEDYSNIATVTIIGNEIPQANNDEYSVNENNTLSVSDISGILVNDTDPDDYPNPLTAELVVSVINGSLTLNTDGSFIYTPNTDFFGVDFFTYQAFDGTNHSNTATTTITVNEVLPPPPGGGGGGGGGGSFNNNPQQASILIDEGRPTTTSSNVVLTLFATNMDSRYAPTQMLLSNDPNMTGAIWVPYSQTYNWTLESGLGQRTVYAIFRNRHGDSQKVSDDIEVIFSPQVLGIQEFAQCTDETEEGDLVLNKDDHSGDATVYYIGGDCRKYFFPDPKTYFTWYTDWSNIRRVGVDILDQHPDGGGVTYRPGTKLVTHLSTSKIYAVEPGGRLTWIPNPEIAANLYGSNWHNLVQDVIEGYFITTYVKDGQLGSILPSGALVKNGTTTYYIENGFRLPFSNQQAFTDHNLKTKDVLNTDVSSYSLGETINGFVNRIWDVVASVANRR